MSRGGGMMSGGVVELSPGGAGYLILELSHVGLWDSWGGAETGWERRVDGRAPLVVLVGEDGRQLVRECLAGARAERLGETRDLPRERLAELVHAHALHGRCSRENVNC